MSLALPTLLYEVDGGYIVLLSLFYIGMNGRSPANHPLSIHLSDLIKMESEERDFLRMKSWLKESFPLTLLWSTGITERKVSWDLSLYTIWHRTRVSFHLENVRMGEKVLFTSQSKSGGGGI